MINYSHYVTSHFQSDQITTKKGPNKENFNALKTDFILEKKKLNWIYVHITHECIYLINFKSTTGSFLNEGTLRLSMMKI